MKKINLVGSLVLLGSVAAMTAPVLAHAADLNVTIGSPGYYQPTYEQRGYRTQPSWEQERDARRQRAIEWREHHGNDVYAYRGEEHHDRRHNAKRHDHHDNGEHRGHGNDKH